ncbi:AprI/Inh family metalloprotease inhibitor [Bartonella sp. B10]
MTFSKKSFIVSIFAIITLGGCTTSRFRNNDRGNTSEIFYPIQQMLVPEITSRSQESKITDSSVYEKRDSRISKEMVNLELPNGAVDLFPASVSGVWNLSVGDKVCRIATPQTKFGQGYRASPLNCTGIVSRVKSWAVKEKKLYFYDQSGRAVIALYSSNVDHFKGRTFDDHPVILTR